jgi:pimeloyl-ACP methyl ester carboxylesterase
MEHLTGDLIGLLDHLGQEKAIWVGHDWGGIVGWQIPLMYPQRTAGVVGLNTPFLPRRPAMDPIAFFRLAFGEEMYIVHFQIPGAADAILARDVDKTMRFFMRKPPNLSGDHFTRPAGSGRSRFALVHAVDAYEPSADRRGEFLDEDELGFFVEAFRRTGFTGPINWYRNFTRPEGGPPGADDHGRERCGAAPFPRRRHGRVRARSGEGADRGVRPLDPAGEAGRGQRRAHRLAESAVSAARPLAAGPAAH